MPEAAPKLLIEIGGTRLSKEAFGAMEQMVIDDPLQLPTTATLHFADPKGDILGKANCSIGKNVEISAAKSGESAATLLFKGEITALEGDFGPTGSRVSVVAYDLSHKLQRGRHTEVYKNAKDSQIAQKIAQRHGIQAGTIEQTSTVFDYVIQANESDWDFLKARARQIGFEVSVTEGKFNFRRPTDASTAPPAARSTAEQPTDFHYNAGMLEFRPRLTGGSQVKEVKVRGWDPKQKKELVATAQAATKSVSLDVAPGKIASDVSSKQPFVNVFLPFEKMAAANETAKAMAEEISSVYKEGEGTVIGDEKLRAGKAVTISTKNGLPGQFAGKHVLSHVRHVFTFGRGGVGYRTHFEVSGRQERSLLGLASMGDTNGAVGHSGSKINGLAIGLVTNIEDPDKLGRVKVKFPWLDDNVESHWARVVQFGAGPKSGSFFLPEVNDEVLVGFEHGDPNFPFVIGGLYNGKDKPDTGIDKGDNDWGTAIAGGKVKRRGFTSRKGHRLLFIDDDSGDHGIIVKTSDGKFKIELKEKGGVLTIFGDPKIVIEAKQDIEIKAGKDFKVEAQSKANLKAAAGVELKSDATFKVEGAMVDVKAQGTADFAGGTTTVKGEAMVQVQAPMVKVG